MVDRAATLNALADRVEQGTEPDRDLDVDIMLAVHYPDYRFPALVLNRRPEDHREALERLRWDGGGGYIAWPAFMRSIDDAVTLKPSDCGLALFIFPEDPPEAQVGSERTKAATPARVVTAACLRAIARGMKCEVLVRSATDSDNPPRAPASEES